MRACKGAHSSVAGRAGVRQPPPEPAAWRRFVVASRPLPNLYRAFTSKCVGSVSEVTGDRCPDEESAYHAWPNRENRTGDCSGVVCFGMLFWTGLGSSWRLARTSLLRWWALRRWAGRVWPGPRLLPPLITAVNAASGRDRNVLPSRPFCLQWPCVSTLTRGGYQTATQFKRPLMSDAAGDVALNQNRLE